MAETFIGVDPALRNFGIVVWSPVERRFIQAVILRTKRSKKLSRARDNKGCVQYLARELGAIIGKYDPSVVVAELPVGSSRSAVSAYAMALAFATVVSVCAIHSIDLELITPTQIKRWASRKKSVEKDLVINAVYSRFDRVEDLLVSFKHADLEHLADAMAAVGVYLKV